MKKMKSFLFLKFEKIAYFVDPMGTLLSHAFTCPFTEQSKETKINHVFFLLSLLSFSLLLSL